MTGLTGIGNLNELQVARPIKGSRNLPANGIYPEKQDGVQFSAEGQQAAEVARFIRESKEAAEIRQEQVDAAKESIQQGRHRVEEVVSVVAEALIGHI